MSAYKMVETTSVARRFVEAMAGRCPNEYSGVERTQTCTEHFLNGKMKLKTTFTSSV